ncbi:MAG: formate dehydrogenase accessory protein FdhE [Alphaproteobacteria bacterium]|nr:formate dehydrogenase accessory protein FdhE [Alphaproteobacteria bacterium]
MTTKAPIADPVDIGKAASAAFLRLPDITTLFRRRAARFAALAGGHPMEDFLRFMSRLAEAQAESLRALKPGGLPDVEEIEAAKRDAMPPFAGDGLLDGTHWRDVLQAILKSVAAGEIPEQTRQVIADLGAEPAAVLDGRARAVLSDDVPETSRGAAVFIAAALQVRWAAAASMLTADGFQAFDEGKRCPVCAQAPLVSMMGPASEGQSTRYLHCRLCASSWNYVRIKCAACGSTEGIAYHGIEDTQQPVRGETCDTCHGYVKILSTEKELGLDPMADDIATTGLDLMLAEGGWERASANPFLLAT